MTNYQRNEAQRLGVETAAELADNEALNAAARIVRAENIRRVSRANRTEDCTWSFGPAWGIS